jgi:cytochrome oxidase Cu insertion factor (SCO1/SenC/PrrC family)
VKPSKAARRRQRDRRALVLSSGGIAGVLLLASLLLWLAPAGPGLNRAEDQIGGPFNLVDDGGNPVTDKSFPGKYLLVYFGYTSCRDICPATLNTLAASLDRLGRKADLVQPLFITIDPAHDSAVVLRQYVGAFSRRLVGLTGANTELNKVADEYRVVRIAHGSAGNASGVTFDHSSVLYLIAPDGRFIAPIPADASEMVMAQAIARYVS